LGTRGDKGLPRLASAARNLIYTRTGAYAEGRVAEAEVTELFDEHESATRVEELAGMDVDRGAAEAKLIALACSPFT
jgi:hypothetical protein